MHAACNRNRGRLSRSRPSKQCSSASEPLNWWASGSESRRTPRGRLRRSRARCSRPKGLWLREYFRALGPLFRIAGAHARRRGRRESDKDAKAGYKRRKLLEVADVLSPALAAVGALQTPNDPETKRCVITRQLTWQTFVGRMVQRAQQCKSSKMRT